MKTARIIRNSKGQFVVEAVLLMVLSLGLFMFASKYLREQKVISNMVENPWNRVSTMIESGVWGPYTPQQLTRHPNDAPRRGVTLLEFGN